MNDHSNIVVIGGGTGSFTLLSALKNQFSHITALVSMADDGGSTGVLRDELGTLPPGDVRQCLVALARDPRMRDLFNYRFEEGTFAGHSFGNLFLTAVEKTTQGFGQAVETASDVLDIVGRVIPLTLDNVRLLTESNGKTTHRQSELETAVFDRPRIWLDPDAHLNPKAKYAIQQADIIVIAPGKLYGSLAPALVVPGLADALAASRAPKVYVCNLVTKPGQTDGFTVEDFAAEIERFLLHKVPLDYVLYNNAEPEERLLKKYAEEGEYWVGFDAANLEKQHYAAIGDHFVCDQPWKPTAKTDLLKRTLIRHNAQKIADHLQALLQ